MKKYLLPIFFNLFLSLSCSQNDFLSGTWSSNENPAENVISDSEIEWIFKEDSVFIQSIDPYGNGKFSKGTFSIIGDTINFHIIEELRISSNLDFTTFQC